jgi:hypothetical protein
MINMIFFGILCNIFWISTTKQQNDLRIADNTNVITQTK